MPTEWNVLPTVDQEIAVARFRLDRLDCPLERCRVLRLVSWLEHYRLRWGGSQAGPYGMGWRRGDKVVMFTHPRLSRLIALRWTLPGCVADIRYVG